MTRHRTAILAGAIAGLAGALLTSCKKEEPPPPPQRPRQTRAPEPEPVTVADLLAQEGADARLQFPQEQAPRDEEFARAVIRFGDALASGDADALRTMLDRDGKNVLDTLTSQGTWYESTGKIDAVRVVYTEGNSGSAVFAVQEPGAAYLMGWNAEKAGDSYVFKAAPTQRATRARASDWDSIGPAAFAVVEMGSGPSEEMAQDVGTTIDEGGAGDDGFEEPERSPGRKNTPAGPIDIPGGG